MHVEIYDNVKLSKNYENLSQSQKDIHQYILANLDTIKEVTVEEIADKCFCSTTTVNRYCKKMGAEGYGELKHALMEYSNYDSKSHNSVLSRKVISKTDGLDLSHVSNIADLLLEKKHVYIFGTGSSYLHAKYLQRLLIRCGINAIASNEVHYLRIIQDVELCIIISNTGETFSAVQVANQFKGSCPIIGFTRVGSRLDSLADLSVLHSDKIVVDDSIDNELNMSTYLMIVALISSISEKLIVND